MTDEIKVFRNDLGDLIDEFRVKLGQLLDELEEKAEDEDEYQKEWENELVKKSEQYDLIIIVLGLPSVHNEDIPGMIRNLVKFKKGHDEKI